MRVYESMTEMIGHTPLFHVSGLSQRAEIFAKLEKNNPAGSAKDRPALEMIEDCERKGLLKEGGTVIEPTSGNTGIALAAICASRGYRAIFTLPDTMSVERIRLLRAYGATVVLTPGSEGMAGAVREADRIHASTPGSVIAGQFVNPANPAAHEKTTAVEIWEDLDGQADVFVAGVGTGGTISGTAHFLKKKNPDIRVIAVEPASSPLLSQGRAGAHGLMGIGANFIPEALDQSVLDGIETVTEEEAYLYARLMARKKGILVGITSGAALCAAKRLADSGKYDGKNIVALLPDSGERYLSTALFEEDGK